MHMIIKIIISYNNTFVIKIQLTYSTTEKKTGSIVYTVKYVSILMNIWCAARQT